MVGERLGYKTEIPGAWLAGGGTGHGWGQACLGQGLGTFELKTFNCLGQAWGMVGAWLGHGWGKVRAWFM